MALFPDRTKPEPYDFGAPSDAEFFVEAMEDHDWRGNKLWFAIRWTLGDLTWQPYEDTKELQALDEYLVLIGIKRWQDLPCKTHTTTGANTRRGKHVTADSVTK